MRAAPFDFHVHSVVSGDSEVPLEDRARSAREVRPHGISDHYPSTHLKSDDDVLRYVERARALGLRVALEYDVGVASPLRPATRDELDYLVVGLHQVWASGEEIRYDDAGAYLKGHVPSFGARERFAGDPTLCAALLEEVLTALRASFEKDRADILAHPTFSPLLACFSPDEAYPAEWQDRLIELCVAHGVAIEVNEAYRVPHAGFLARARVAGATFSVGSDSHGPLLSLDYTERAIAQADIGARLREVDALSAPRRAGS